MGNPPQDVDTTRPRFRDHHFKEGEAEIRRIQACRAKAPRCAALLDEVDEVIERGRKTEELLLASVYLDARLSRGLEIRPEHEQIVREMLARARG